MQAAKFRFPTIVAGALIVSACGGGGGSDGSPPVTGSTPPPDPGFVVLQSDPGDAIGEGLDYRYTQADARYFIQESQHGVRVWINGDEDWVGDFELPDSFSRVEVGVYSNLGQYPFHDPAIGGMRWAGGVNQCNALTGSFEVTSVTYANGFIDDIKLNFEQYCDGSSAALRGDIHWYADDKTFPPAPVRPPPTALWTPAPGTTPDTGNYVYFESEAGDTMGAGSTYLYTPDIAAFNVTAHNRIFLISINGSESWVGSFEAMDFLVEIERGYYPDLQRYGEHNPVKGGLYWRGEGRSCGDLSGWFAIDDITYDGAEIQTIKLRFEQRCNGDAGALHGAIAWSR